MYLSAEKVLVGLSRVESLQHLRILPFAPGQTDNHLLSLKPCDIMLNWFNGYAPDGVWSAARSAASIAKYPLPTKRKQRQNSSSTPQTRQPPKQKPSNIPSPSMGTTSSKSVSSLTSVSGSIRVVAQFRLNMAHALSSDSARLFHSFDIPGDGDCLFTSFIRSLHLSTSVSSLRRQVVDSIADEQDPAIRLSALNTHIAREQEFNNSAYNNIDLFDAGTVFSPGQMDVRFSDLWVRYSDEMLHNAWAGNTLLLPCLSFIFNIWVLFLQVNPK